MKKIVFTLLLAVVFLLEGCEKHHIYSSELVIIDSLLNMESNDSAMNLLKRINKQYLRNNDIAYYNLLITVAANNMEDSTVSEDDINQSVKYFKRTNDTHKLSRSLLYQGLVFMCHEKTKEAMLSMKQAESLAKSLNDDNLYIEISKNLAYFNAVVGNYSLSEIHARKALKKAKQIDDKISVGYCYHLLTVCFSNRGNKDSSDYYQTKTIPYIEIQPKRVRYKFYFNAATYYWRRGEYAKAEASFKKSLEVRPWELSYGALSELLIEQGRYNETDSLWAKAFATKDMKQRSRMMWSYSKWLWKQDRRQEAWDVAIQIPLLKDSIARRQQAEELQLVQNRYEQQLAEMQQRNKIQQMVICGLCVVLILSLAGFILWRRLQRIRQRLAESQKETEVYILQLRREQEEIAKLEQEQRQLQQMHARSEQEHNDGEAALSRKIKGKEHKVKELQRKIQTLREEQGTMLARGKRKYEDIMNGGNTNGWHKSDYVDFMNYYRLDHFDFFESRDDIWQTMTPREQLFVILHDMGMTKEEVLFAMGLSKGAYRTISSRISNKGE